MARPIKQGLEYFALDVDMNDEVELIEAVHGLVGFAILIKLFQKIYSEGYYIDWQERDRILFTNRVSDDRNRVTTVVSDCIRWGIFDKKLYDKYGILTSRRIQDQYFTATYKRVQVFAVKEYLLVDVKGKPHVSIVGVSDDGNGATTRVSDDRNKATTGVSDDKSTQSKSKSKSKSSTESKSNTEILSTTESKTQYGDTIAQKRSGDRSMPETKAFIKMPLNDGSFHSVTFEDLTTYKELYQAVDVEQELRAMVGWLDSNPTRRKTNRGVKGFITGWLKRTQDRSRSGGNGQSRPVAGKYYRDNRWHAPEEPDDGEVRDVAYYQNLTKKIREQEAANAQK